MTELVNDKKNLKRNFIQELANIFIAKNQIFNKYEIITDSKNSQIIMFLKHKFTNNNLFHPDWINEKFELKKKIERDGMFITHNVPESAGKMFNYIKHDNIIYGYHKFGRDISDWSRCFQVILMFLFDMNMDLTILVTKLQKHWFWYNLIENWKNTFYIFYLFLLDNDIFDFIKEKCNSKVKNQMQTLARNILTIPGLCDYSIWFEKGNSKNKTLNYLISKIGYKITYSNDVKNFITNKSKCYTTWIDKGISNQKMTSEELYYIICWAIKCDKNITISYGNYKPISLGGFKISDISIGNNNGKRESNGLIYEYNETIYLSEGPNTKFEYKDVKIQVNN